MKISRNDIESRREAAFSGEQQGTKENPYQPPWVRKLQQTIGIVVFVALTILFYNLFMEVGGRVPETVKSAESYLERERQAVESRLAAAEAERRQNPASAQAMRVFARAVSGAPGAIVCQDYQAVRLVFSLYNRRFEDRLLDVVTKGLSRSVRGEPAGEPDPALFGCALIPDGRPMMKEPVGIFPVVSVRLDDGTYVKGVTMLPMVVERMP
ncbi:MAG: hypothetical protein ACRC9K_03165 [Afipia sp.]